MSIRQAKKIFAARPTVEGAGVRLHRVFGYGELSQFDPFLMLDDFSSSDPGDYSSGFPWHPHRGIETVTYVISGTVRHKDSIGNEGTISNGAVQWMTAGSGILHQEMPDPSEPLTGFQLWVNLPKSHKMMAPRYQDILPGGIQAVEDDDAIVKVVAGAYGGVTGPISDLVVDTLFFDVTVKPGRTFSRAVPTDHTVFFYVLEGAATVAEGGKPVQKGEIALLGEGEEVALTAGGEGARLLFIAGKPIGEPIAWHGPIVMNSQEEIGEALGELDAGTFVK